MENLEGPDTPRNEVGSVIREIKDSKVAGLDETWAELLKAVGEFVIGNIT